MAIPVEKWLVMALLTCLSVLIGLLPHILFKTTKSIINTGSYRYKLVLTTLSCFGAGVLLSTAMLHLLPELREKFNEIPDVWETFDAHFPISEVVVLFGFCLIFLVEEIAHFIMVDGHHGHHHHINTVARHNSIAHALPIPNVTKSATLTRTREIPGNSLVVTVTNDTPPRKHSGIDSMDTSLEEECPHDQETFSTSLRTFLALIALSFHAIMEGIVIGLQESTSVWVMFGAVASHKFIISFCMGMELVASHTKLITSIGSIAFFAVVSPIGIIIGSVLTSTQESSQSVGITVVEGLACGTILYVVFFEILNRERERKNYSMSRSRAVGFAQFGAMLAGLVLMGYLLTAMHGHSHGSDDEHSHGHEDDHEHDDEHDHDH